MNFLFSLSKYFSWPTVLLIEKTMRDRLYCQCCILIKVYQWVTADAVLVPPLIQTMTQYPILISTMLQRTEALDLWPFHISTRHFLNQLMEQTSLFPRPRRSERPNKGTMISLHKVIVFVCVLSQFNGSIRCGISIKDITEARLRCWSAEVETVNFAAWMHTLTQFWRWRLGDSVCSSMNEMRSSNKLQELNILKSKSHLQNNSTLQSVARRIIFWKFCGENMLTSSIYSAGISLHLLLWKLTDAVVLYKITNL